MSDRYPRQPRPAVLAVVPRRLASDQPPRLLFVRRAGDPDRDRWGFPGGKVELGERLTDAARRELREETAVAARPLEAVWAGDVIHRDVTGAVLYHYILTAVLCRWRRGEGTPGSDATDCAWLSLEELDALGPDAAYPDVRRLAALALGVFTRLEIARGAAGEEEAPEARQRGAGA